MASLFLSYDHDDHARAAPIAAALQANGHSVWWDRAIHGGAEYNSEIEKAVESADAVVVLWSASSVRSAWVRDEAAEGRDRGKLVPVLIEAVKPPMGFRQYQTLDLSEWTGGKRIPSLAELLDAIDKVAGSATKAAPVRARPVSPPAHARAAPSYPRVSRRALLGGTAAAAAIVAGGSAWWLSRDRSDPRFKTLVDKAEDAIGHSSFNEQTIQTLEQAVAIRPRSAKALGLLALVKSAVAQRGGPAYAARLVPEAETTARQALSIDPNEPNALLAMFELQGAALDWFTRDRKLRQVLSMDPKNILAISELILLLQATGYVHESWDWNERALALEPLSSQFLGRRAFKLWIRGQVPEADKVADQLRALYPADPWSWYVRFKIYAFTGRARAALAMLSGDPAMVGSASLARFCRTSLQAMDGPTPATIAMARQTSIEGAKASAEIATEAVQVMSALGDLDTAFEIANGLLLQRGPIVQQVQGQGDADAVIWRIGTQWMFTPPADPMRADARFMPLCVGVGLTDYWRKRGTRPDYMRT